MSNTKRYFCKNKQTLVDAIADCDKQVVELNQQNVKKINSMKETQVKTRC